MTCQIGKSDDMTSNLQGKRMIEFHSDETWCRQLPKAMTLDGTPLGGFEFHQHTFINFY
jgi:hypothetical protein